MATHTKETYSPSQRRRQERKRQVDAQRRKRLLWQLGLVGAAAILVVGAFIAYSQLSGTGGTHPPVDYASIPSDGMTLGAADAPVTLVEYGDYRCIHCADLTVEDAPQMIQDFITNGTLRYEFRAMPILGGVAVDDPANPSVLAAESAMCAADQGGFWPYHDRLMTTTHQRKALGDDAFRAAASDAGLDPEALMTCVNASTHRQAVIDSYTQATAQGITSTPTLYLQGAQITWTGNYDILKKQIDAARDR